MIAFGFSHWGLTILPDTERMSNVIISADGSVERLELDEPMHMMGTYPRKPEPLPRADYLIIERMK